MKEKINHIRKYFNQVESIARLISKNEIDSLVKELVKIKKKSGRVFF